MECWEFDHHELPLVPGGYRAGLTSGIAKYLGIDFELAGNAREKAMLAYPEAFCRLVRACANEARAMMREGVEPFAAAVDQREKEKPKTGTRAVIYIEECGDKAVYRRNITKAHAERLIAELSKKDSGQNES